LRTLKSLDVFSQVEKCFHDSKSWGACGLFWLDWLYRESAIAGIKQHHTQKNSPEKLAASKVVCHGIDIVLMLCYRHEELSYLWRRCERLP